MNDETRERAGGSAQASATADNAIGSIDGYCASFAEARALVKATMALNRELVGALRAVVEDWELTVKCGVAIQDSPCTRGIVRAALKKAGVV